MKNAIMLSNLTYLFIANYFSNPSGQNWINATVLGLLSLCGYILHFTHRNYYFKSIIVHFIWLIPLFMVNVNYSVIRVDNILPILAAIFLYKVYLFDYIYDDQPSLNLED
tara:strand:- start:328 stop:657 length:330 start_codon:yes stop_codon:yes gene_type:complete